MFEPIAIIGRACLFPGALNPEQLWQNVLQAKNCLQPLTKAHIGIDPKSLREDNKPDYIATDVSGYIEGFESLFNPQHFLVSVEEMLRQDLSSRWLSHTGREALKDAGYSLEEISQGQAGAILGNLSYPTSDLSSYAETVWLANQNLTVKDKANFQSSELLNKANQRFMSGLPLHFMAKALGLQATCYAIDAACASSLYAIKLACDQLQDGKADIMLAGGINATDSLFLHLGFTALQALSPTGQSRPLHAEANGLIPAQGVGIVVLKRLQDAIKDKNAIHGVIRGIGLSNDGNTRGFLVPAESGQIKAMAQAYELSGINPSEVSWVECHATGTPIGDATEIRSMQEIFFASKNLNLGALKANIGHSITASGAASLIKVLSAFAAKTKPPNLYATDAPMQALTDSGFQVLAQAQPWDSQKPRLAGINAFGFGGNNAHLLVEEWQAQKLSPLPPAIRVEKPEPIAIVGLSIIAAKANNHEQFFDLWLKGESALSEYQPGLMGGFMGQVELNIKNTRFPPVDLQHALGQQLAILKAAQQALEQLSHLSLSNSSIYVGMQCDAEVSRYGLRVRLAELLNAKDPGWLAAAQNQIHAPLEASDAIGAMPNIVTNRLNVQFDAKAPSFSVSAEEASGLIALELGMRDLRTRVCDSSIVGAVDMCCELVQRTAAVNILAPTMQIPGDAAVVLILKRLSDAKAQGDKIYAIISEEEMSGEMLVNPKDSSITQQFGHAHAASGLLHVAAAAIACDKKQWPGMREWACEAGSFRQAKITVEALGGKERVVYVRQSPKDTLSS